MQILLIETLYFGKTVMSIGRIGYMAWNRAVGKSTVALLSSHIYADYI